MTLVKANEVTRRRCRNLKKGDVIVTERAYGGLGQQYEVRGTVSHKVATGAGFQVFHSGIFGSDAWYGDAWIYVLKK